MKDPPGSKCPCIGNDLLLVALELRLDSCFEGNCKACDGVVVRAALQSWEDCLVDLCLQILAVENHACTPLGCEFQGRTFAVIQNEDVILI